MKLSLLIILITILQVSASVYSQNTILDLQVKDKTMREVFKVIEQQSDFRFFFNDEFSDLNKNLNLNISEKRIDDIMALILKDSEVTYRILENDVIVITPLLSGSSFQQRIITGTVTEASTGNPMPGVNIVVTGTTIGALTDINGKYSIEIPPGAKSLTFSFIGMETQEITIGALTSIDIKMFESAIRLDEVVVVGYGTQKKSDITGAVASLGAERLEMTPNLNIAQAIQGAVPGVIVQTSTAGAVADQSIMIRGRNSILASNNPLIVVDGISYSGSLSDLNPNDVKSIEMLKDASAAAIYGSRGANGVILVTTKMGETGKPKISYEGYYSVQSFVKLPDLMDGEQFYNYKTVFCPDLITQSEQEIYDSGQWTDWLDLALRNGNGTEHNLSVSGGFNKTNYYISGGVLKVRGLAVNDDYLRLTSRINLDTEITDWLTIGTRTQLSYGDQGGISPEDIEYDEQGNITSRSWDYVFTMNPLSKAYDENGNLTIYPWEEDPHWANPLQGTLATDTYETYQAISNNYVIVKFPFIPGLQYRINAGIKIRFRDRNTYYGRNTTTGYENSGSASTGRYRDNTTVIENIVDYNREFGKHKLFLTGVYSFESDKRRRATVTMKQFPHDFLTWYSAGQAGVISPGYSYNETALTSQMLRLNYSYDSRYLLTLTGRRDGFSGFGVKTKWGVFPSVALGWNIADENFFPWKGIINELKLRGSYGLNGNQAVGAYETISRLSSGSYVTGTTTLAGYVPSKLGVDNLGWESTKTFNMGVDFGLLSNRLTGDVSYFKSNTFDLLLNRSISPVHGITSITQNIGKTENQGFEASFVSRNIVKNNFQWITSANITFIKNKIVSLYGELNENGEEIDDVGNKWFIGQPIRVNYGYVWEGVWQVDEADEAALYGTQPGYIKIEDVVGDDHQITAEDRQIVGQRDPKFLWGMTNTWSYKNLSLSVFIHGMHGITKENPLMIDYSRNGGSEARRNITNHAFWILENPNTIHPIARPNSWFEHGVTPMPIEKAGFVRVKDITLSYDLAKSLFNRLGFDKLQLYFTGRNLFTITNWTGLDPELDNQSSVPLQKEFVFGLNLGF